MTIDFVTIAAIAMPTMTALSFVAGIWWNLNRRIESLRVRLAEHQTAMAEKLGERVTGEMLEARLGRLEDMVRQEIRDLRSALTGGH